MHPSPAWNMVNSMHAIMAAALGIIRSDYICTNNYIEHSLILARVTSDYNYPAHGSWDVQQYINKSASLCIPVICTDNPDTKEQI